MCSLREESQPWAGAMYQVSFLTFPRSGLGAGRETRKFPFLVDSKSLSCPCLPETWDL